MIVSEYRGLTVKEIAEIRRALRKQDVSYRVVKNRLMKIAAQDTVGEALGAAPHRVRRRSPSARTRRATAKAVIDATRPYRIVRITGGVLGDRAIDADSVTRLATLPSREVLLAKLAGAIQSPTARHSPGCSPRTSATSGLRWPRSATRRPRPKADRVPTRPARRRHDPT